MARMASVGETIEREVGRILERDPASTPSVLPEAQAAAKYVASFVQSSIFPAGSPKEVMDLVHAIRGLRRRRLFCEATFRSELRKNSLSCGILLSWELSRCGVLTWWDHLPSVLAEPEGVLGLEREAAGGVLERLVRDSGDLEEGEDRHRDLRSLEALNAVRGLWREPGRDRRAYRLLSALDATRSAFPEPLHRSFWANELRHLLLSGEGAEAAVGVLDAVCREVLPSAAPECLSVLRAAIAGAPGRDEVAMAARAAAVAMETPEGSSRVEEILEDLGAAALESRDARVLSNVLLCSQFSHALRPATTGEGGDFRAWLAGYLQRQVDRRRESPSGFNSATTTQFLLKVFGSFVPHEPPETLMLHKEVVKVVDGLNESYVRDYVNLVQARLSDFGIPGRQMRAFREQFR